MKKDKENYIAGLADYIKKNLNKGYTLESLKWALVNQGNSKLEIEKAIRKAESEMPRHSSAIQESEKPKITHEIIPVEQEDSRPWWKKMIGL